MIARRPEREAREAEVDARESESEARGARVPTDSDVTPIPTGFLDLPELRGGLPAPAPVPAIGFRAELSGASLWDLVRMECQARSRRVVQVTGEGGVGYLYFAGGRVIHAVTPRLSGESAALEILSWRTGAFHPCERGWPTVATIDAPHESLILRAATRRDDATETNLVTFRGRLANYREDQAPRPGHQQAPQHEQSEPEEVAMAEIRRPSNSQPTGPFSLTRSEGLPEFSVMIRVGPNGAVLKNKGATEDLAGVVAYTHRLVELVGELLGLDRFVAMECTFKETPGQSPGGAGIPRYLLFSEANGDTVAVRPQGDSNIQPLRESLGL